MVYRGDRDFHLQRTEEIFEIPRALCQTLPLRLCMIHFSAAAIIFADIEFQKVLASNQAQSPFVIAGVLWPFRNGNLRDRISHTLTFYRAVIDKDQAVNSDIQSARDLADVLRLVVPVDLGSRKMLLAKNHCGMFANRFIRVFRIILAANRQQGSLLPKVQQLTLKIYECKTDAFVTKLDSRHPVFPDNSSP